MKDKDLRDMSRADLEDEVMLLRAQVKVLQNEAAIERRAFQEMVSTKPRLLPRDPFLGFSGLPTPAELLKWGRGSHHGDLGGHCIDECPEDCLGV